jgi:hypothetical protein
MAFKPLGSLGERLGTTASLRDFLREAMDSSFKGGGDYWLDACPDD